MKKNIFSLVAIAAISLSAWNYSENQNNVELSDLALENVEALASGEDSDPGHYVSSLYTCLIGPTTTCDKNHDW